MGVTRRVPFAHPGIDAGGRVPEEGGAAAGIRFRPSVSGAIPLETNMDDSPANDETGGSARGYLR